MQAERGIVEVHGRGEAEGSMMFMAMSDLADTELRDEAYARWYAEGAVGSFHEYCRRTKEAPIADQHGRFTGRTRVVRYPVLESAVPIDDWVGRSVVHQNICCDREMAYSEDKVHLFFLDPEAQALPPCSLSPVAPELVNWDSARKYLKNGVLGDRHDALMAKIAAGINHFPINTVAGAVLQCLAMALASITRENCVPNSSVLSTCEFFTMAQFIKVHYAHLLPSEVTIGWTQMGAVIECLAQIASIDIDDLFREKEPGEY